MNDRLLKLAESLFATDVNFQRIRAAQREKELLRKMDKEDWGTNDPSEDAKIMNHEQNKRILEAAGVQSGKAKSERINESKYRMSQDEQLFSEDPHWEAAKKMTKGVPGSGSVSLEYRIIPARPMKMQVAPDLGSDHTGLSDEEILRGNSQNWDAARELGENQYAQPALEEANPGNEDPSYNDFELTEENRDMKIDRLNVRIEKLSRDGVAEGDWETKMHYADLVEDLKARRGVLSGEWSE